MAIHHASHGEVVDVNDDHGSKTTAFVKEERFEVIRVVVTPDKPLPPHAVDGPITVQCLDGICRFFVEDEPRTLVPGSWLYLKGGTPHAVEAVEATALLVTIVFVPD